LQPGVPTLLVSFARSGNSPESVAAVELADRLVDGCRHLAFTCAADGMLNRRLGTPGCSVSPGFATMSVVATASTRPPKRCRSAG
ncbi:hypothetical protein QM312_37395, partial [Burkholderia cenocepacia]|nr:hypothetical protein [Burkholderia cenocepacia]